MAAIQVAVAGALTAWAVWRLRPASRALYDVEGRIGMLRALRAANRTLPRRRPCGDDPVLWNEKYWLRVRSRAGRVAGRLVRLAWAGLLAVGTWWFAAPAFVELAERGYGPSPEAYTMPEIEPAGAGDRRAADRAGEHHPEPGQARLEFNLALRQFSAMAALGFVVDGLVVRGRERDQGARTRHLARPARDPALRPGHRPRQGARGPLEGPRDHGHAGGPLDGRARLGRGPPPGVPGRGRLAGRLRPPLRGDRASPSALPPDRPKWPLNPAGVAPDARGRPRHDAS